jgi:O-antigen ligase
MIVSAIMLPPRLAPGHDWTARLRQANLWLFAILPAMLLFWRGGAEVVTAVIGISYLAVVTVRREWRVALYPPVLVLLALWLVLNLLVSPLAIDPATSFSRSLLWLRFVVLFAAITTWLVQSPRDVKLIVAAWGATVGFAILDGLIQLIRGVSLTGRPISGLRLTGPLDRPNIGMFVARIGFPLLAGTALLLAQTQHPATRRIVFAFIAAGLALGFILLTGERAASLLTLIALLASIGLIILCAPSRYRFYGLLVTGIAIGVMVGIVFASERILSRVHDTLEVFSDFWNSPYGQLFSAGLHAWQEYPITGVGMKNFQIACQIMMGDALKDGCHPHPHNIYIEWLAETGILGFLGFVTFLGCLAASCLALLKGSIPDRIIGALVAGCFILLLFPLTASQSFFSNWPAILLWASLSMTAAIAGIAHTRAGETGTA